MINIVSYNIAYAKDLASIYYNTIHNININDYSQKQVNEWAPKTSLKIGHWLKKWESIPPLVAIKNDIVVGFAEFDKQKGYIDCFYVHHMYQNYGIGTKLMQEIIAQSKIASLKSISADVSITAESFFKHHGFIRIAKQEVLINEIKFYNFKMSKLL